MLKFIIIVWVSIFMKSDCYVYVDVCSSNGTAHSEQACLSHAQSISDTRSNEINLQLSFDFCHVLA
jgi:hypothetical protein